MNHLIILLFLFFPLLLVGQTERYTDPEAREILQGIEQSIETTGHVHYTFRLGIHPPERDSIIQDGAYWQQGTSYRLDLDDYTFISDGVSQWVVDKASQEIQIHDYEDPDPSEVAHPQNLLKIYQNPNFRYRLTDSDLIEFIPMETDFEYFRAIMQVESDPPDIASIQVWSKDGSRYAVHMTDTHAGVAPPAEKFQLIETDFPGYHIEDLRIN